MRANRLVLPSSFCWNRDCPGYGLENHGNIALRADFQQHYEKVLQNITGKRTG